VFWFPVSLSERAHHRLTYSIFSPCGPIAFLPFGLAGLCYGIAAPQAEACPAPVCHARGQQMPPWPQLFQRVSGSSFRKFICRVQLQLSVLVLRARRSVLVLGLISFPPLNLKGTRAPCGFSLRRCLIFCVAFPATKRFALFFAMA
jgi:hypothetical protein